MDAVRAKALKLRLAGNSYNEIQKHLGVPKSTQSGWFKELVLSDSAKARLSSRLRIGGEVLIRRNKMQTVHAERRAREAQAQGRSRISDFSEHDLLMLGAALYWAEGYKRLSVRDGKQRMSHVISFLNTDPAMICAFIGFLRDCLEIPSERIYLTMRLYPHINELEARCYWSKVTGFSAHSFLRTTTMISAASKGKRPFNRLPYGTLRVSVNDTLKFHHLLGLIEGVKEKSCHARLVKKPG